MREERLQENAAAVGAYLLARLQELQVGAISSTHAGQGRLGQFGAACPRPGWRVPGLLCNLEGGVGPVQPGERAQPVRCRGAFQPRPTLRPVARPPALQAEHPELVGDVRGEGLMLGIELVTDSSSRAPSPALARYLKTHAKQRHRVLLSTEGPFSSVIKVKPPLCFSASQADAMVAALRDGLARLGPEQRAALAAASRQEAADVAARLARLS